MKLYGIKNCNTVQKALQWFKENDIVVEFHDYKTMGIDATTLHRWTEQVGWETLVNKKGTTWKQLDEQVKNEVIDTPSAIQLMLTKSSVIKRPVIEVNGKVKAVGYEEDNYGKLFHK